MMSSSTQLVRRDVCSVFFQLGLCSSFQLGRWEPGGRSSVITTVQGSVKTRFCAADHTPIERVRATLVFSKRVNPFTRLLRLKKQEREVAMNHSMYSADRATHLKIVVIGIVCATAVAMVGIFANAGGGLDLGTAPLVKAGEPTALSGQVPTIR
jgi:hypothetical protein